MSRSCSHCCSTRRRRRPFRSPRWRSRPPRRRSRSARPCGSPRGRWTRGQPVTGAAIAWYSGGTEGDVDSTGLVKGGYNGYVRVTAVAFIPGQQGQVFGDAVIHVLPEPAARIDVAPAPARVIAGTRLTLAGAAYSKHGDRRADLVSFSSSNPRVATLTADGRPHTLASGR